MPRSGEHAGMLGDILRLGRGLPQKLRREMEARPEMVLATLSGASFLAGAVLGSRIGRALLAAAIPLGLQHLFETEYGPKLWDYFSSFIEGAANTNGTTHHHAHAHVKPS